MSNSVNILYNANEPLKSEINTLKKEKNALKQEINNLKQEMNPLKQKAKNKDTHAILLQKKHKKVLDELKQLKNNSNRFRIQKDSNGEKLDEFLACLNEHLQCPIVLETFKNPVLTPSGNTVEGSVMKTLVQNKALDPFTRNGVCKQIIPNLLVRQISELYVKFSS